MTKKTLEIKIPLSIYTDLSERGRLNPTFINEWIATHITDMTDLTEVHIVEPTPNYSFKVDRAIHKQLRQYSLDHDLTMNELVGRAFTKFY